MSPSHQIRIQQAACEHDYQEIHRALGHVTKTCRKCDKTILEPDDNASAS